MVVFPPCKINIGLQILNRRMDGFHNIHTIFYPLPFYDVLELIPASETKLHLYGLSIQGNVSDNLCTKAYQLLKKDFPGLPAYDIHLYKHIPMGAGLGGGSSDAALVLRLINQKAQLQLTKKQLLHYATRLGSDCSFFIEDQACLAEGRGEILHPISTTVLQGYYLVLLCPDIRVNTSKAYSLIHPQPVITKLANLFSQPVSSWKGNIVNDFEDPVFRLHPSLKELKEILYKKGAEYASLSGSGAALYGLFPHPVNAKEFITENIRAKVFHL